MNHIFGDKNGILSKWLGLLLCIFTCQLPGVVALCKIDDSRQREYGEGETNGEHGTIQFTFERQSGYGRSLVAQKEAPEILPSSNDKIVPHEEGAQSPAPTRGPEATEERVYWNTDFVTAGGLEGIVRALAFDQQGNLYAAGDFLRADTTTVSHVARWDGQRWEALGSGLDGSVYAIVTDSNGNVWVGGDFTHAGDLPVSHIAKWNGVAWESLETGVNGPVLALAVDTSGTVYAGGEFTEAGGRSVNFIARWSGSQWQSLGGGVDNKVRALAVARDNTLYVGGDFHFVEGAYVPHLAAWKNGMWKIIGASDGSVSAITIDPSGRIYVGGSFTSIGGCSANNIAMRDAEGWHALGSGVSGAVTALAIEPSGIVYAGGGPGFTFAGGIPVSKIAKWNGSSWDSMQGGISPGETGSVYALAVGRWGGLYVGGDFVHRAALGWSRYLAFWNGATWSTLGLSARGTVYCVMQDRAGRLLVGGDFGVAQVTGNKWEMLGQGMNGPVEALAEDSSGTLYAGGRFTQADGQTALRIAKWNGQRWVPLINSINSTIDGSPPVVHALIGDEFGNIYVAGNFYFSRNGAFIYSVAKWNGNDWEPLGYGIHSVVWTLGLDRNGNVYAGGSFNKVDGLLTPANNVAMWDGTQWQPMGSGVDAPVYSLSVGLNGAVYVGGEFTTAGGAPANHVARWVPSLGTWSALSTGVDGSVFAVRAAPNGDVYVGGRLDSAGSLPILNVARWTGHNWDEMAGGVGDVWSSVYSIIVDHAGYPIVGGLFSRSMQNNAPINLARFRNGLWETPGSGVFDGPVCALAYDSLVHRVYVGGDFQTNGSLSVSHVAECNGTGFLEVGEGVNGPVYALATSAESKLFVGGSFSGAGTTTSAANVAAWDGVKWTELGMGTDGPVTAMVSDGGSGVYVGGWFVNAGGTTVNYVAHWTGSEWLPLGTGLNAAVTALARNTSGVLYAGGFFTRAGGKTANYVAMWTGTSWEPVGEGLDAPVSCLAVDKEGRLYVGGRFTSAGGISALHVAMWNGLSWQPLGEGIDGTVNSVAIGENNLVCWGGLFSGAGGVSSPNLIAWDGQSWRSLGSGADGEVLTLLVRENSLLVGGRFARVGNRMSPYFAIWQPRVDVASQSISAAPGNVRINDSAWGLCHPELEITGGTTVTYPGGLPTTVTIERAPEITVGGSKVTGAYLFNVPGMAFFGGQPTLRTEFTAFDVENFGAPSYQDFRAVRLIYSSNYPSEKEAAYVELLPNQSQPQPVRLDNGVQIYRIDAPIPMINQGAYAAVPFWSAGNISISPDYRSVVREGATGLTVNVDVLPSNLQWRAWTDVPWIKVPANSSTTGSGVIVYDVIATDQSTTRVGHIVFGSVIHTVEQAPLECSYELAPVLWEVPAEGVSNLGVDLSTGQDCPWEAEVDVPWITIVNGTNGIGPYSILYNVEPYYLSQSRDGHISVGGAIHIVRQRGVECVYTFTPDTATIEAEGTTESAVSVTASAEDCAWTASVDVAWITITSGDSGTGNGTITYSVEANALSASRTGHITVGSAVHTVTQSGVECTYSVSPETTTVVASGASGVSVSVIASASDCAWTASVDVPWITLTSGGSGTGNGTITYSVEANALSASRTGHIAVGDGMTTAVHTVTQSGVECTYSVSPETRDVDAAGATDLTVSVTASASDCAWTASVDAPWITITSGGSGTGNGTITYSVEANALSASRTGHITVGSAVHTVTQSGVECTYSVSPESRDVDAAGATGLTVAVTASAVDCAWTASVDVPWLTITSGGSGTGNGTITYSVDANALSASRTGHITVGSAVHTVTQSGVGDYVLESADFAPFAPTGVQPGTVLDCEWTMSGPETTQPMWLEFFASRTGGFDLLRVGGTVTQSFKLDAYPGGTQTFRPGNQLVNWLPDGIYTLVPYVNRPGTGGPNEVAWWNNWSPIAGKRLRVRNTMLPQCDLLWETTPTVVRNGDEVSLVGGVVRNAGPSSSPEYGFWVEAMYGWLSAEGTFFLQGYVAPGLRVSGLAPGATIGFNQTGRAPAGTAIVVLIDSTALVTESNEQNNGVVLTPELLPGGCGSIDLEIVSASIDPSQLEPAEVDPNGTLRWTCTVRNNSSEDARDVWIELFASESGGLDYMRSGITLTRSEKITVPAHSQQTFNFNQAFEKLPDGTYSVVAVVNRCGVPDNPGDVDPSNNRRVLSGRVVLRNPASSVANLEWETTPTVSLVGTHLTVSGRVRNVGTGSTGPFWTEVFYGTLDASGMFTIHGTPCGGQHCSNLGPGETLDVGFDAYVPEGVMWTIGVITDSTDLVPETDETDNYYVTTP